MKTLHVDVSSSIITFITVHKYDMNVMHVPIILYTIEYNEILFSDGVKLLHTRHMYETVSYEYTMYIVLRQ